MYNIHVRHKKSIENIIWLKISKNNNGHCAVLCFKLELHWEPFYHHKLIIKNTVKLNKNNITCNLKS